MAEPSSPLRGLIGGVAGACALTLLHESARRLVPEAPRMDLLGMRALAKGIDAAGYRVPPEGTLHTLALFGDLAGNALYYSLAAASGGGEASRAETWRRGALLGLAAGFGGVLLPPWLGLGRRPSGRSPTTRAITVALYLAGGLVAAAVANALASSDHRSQGIRGIDAP